MGSSKRSDPAHLCHPPDLIGGMTRGQSVRDGVASHNTAEKSPATTGKMHPTKEKSLDASRLGLCTKDSVRESCIEMQHTFFLRSLHGEKRLDTKFFVQLHELSLLDTKFLVLLHAFFVQRTKFPCAVSQEKSVDAKVRVWLTAV